MNPGTLENSLESEVKENRKGAQGGVSRQDVNAFLDEIAEAINQGPTEGDNLPWVEVDRKVIEHYNRGKMGGFDEAMYFIFHGVKVYETGKREEARTKENRTTEQVIFGGKK